MMAMTTYKNGLDIGRWNKAMSKKDGLGNYVPGGRKLKSQLLLLSTYNPSIALKMDNCFMSGVERIEKCRKASDKKTQQEDRHTRNYLKIVVRGFLWLVAILKKGSRVTEDGQWYEVNRKDYSNLITPSYCNIEGHKLYERGELEKFANLHCVPITVVQEYYNYKKRECGGKQAFPLKKEPFDKWYKDIKCVTSYALSDLPGALPLRKDPEKNKHQQLLEKVIKGETPLEERVLELERFNIKLLKTVNVLTKI